MKTWLLIIVLLAPSNVEQHVAIIVPDEETCEAIREMFVYSVLIDPGEEEDIRIPLTVDEVRCKEVIDD
jgi:hypothetical protein